ncbi:MAG TPA: glutathione S-transferase [Methylophilaceae bacterium]|nr:glutathione S-transferase [Methylophilaceae bacterium]
MELPILYSYRRCPYAMRARMALRYAGIGVEIREISLRDKPKHLSTVSPKATVPVLVLPDGQVIDESLDIMDWALNQQDLDGWRQINLEAAKTLIAENDGTFKQALDAYKYADRHPEKTKVEHRQDGEVFLSKLEGKLATHGDFLFGQLPTMADVAIFPFIRQFKGVDSQWFESSPYPKLNNWLNSLINSKLFISIMVKHPTYVEA